MSRESMKYRMKVWISNPDSEIETSSYIIAPTIDTVRNFHRIRFELNAHFGNGSGFDYGNGYWVTISGKNFSPLMYDIRYDRSFNPDKADKWLALWAKQYWSGNDGAYKLDDIEITECQDNEE